MTDWQVLTESCKWFNVNDNNLVMPYTQPLHIWADNDAYQYVENQQAQCI